MVSLHQFTSSIGNWWSAKTAEIGQKLTNGSNKLSKWKIYAAAAILAFAATGCGAFSATTLRCGTSDDESYVEIASAPQSIANNTRALADLCGFAYSEERVPTARLNLIDAE